MAKNNCEYIIPNHIKGDTWDGLEILLEEENPDYDPEAIVEEGEEPIPEFLPINLTGVDVLIQFRLTNDSPVVFEFSTLEDTVLIPYPLTGVFIIPPVEELTYPAQRYIFDVQLTFPTGKVHTILTGAFAITNDISRR